MKNSYLKKGLYLIFTIIISLGLSISFQSILASWTAPTLTAPGNNIDAPVNEGVDAQGKLGSLAVEGDFLVSNSAVALGNLAVGLLSTSNVFQVAALIKFATASYIANTSIGYTAGNFLTNSSPYNTFIGSRSGYNTASGQSNTAVGFHSLYNNNNNYNSALGFYSLDNNSTGSSNSAFGAQSLAANTSGYSNNAFGLNSLTALTTGGVNSAFGEQALPKSTTGHNSTAFGAESLHDSLSGINNVALGRYAGRFALGSGNIFVGSQAGYFETGANQLYVSNTNSTNPLVKGDFSTKLLTFNAKVGIGTSTPNKSLHLYESTGDNAEIDIQSVSGIEKHWSIYQDRESGDLRFWNNTPVVEKNILTLTEEGNIGIGNTNPTEKLDVAGNIKADLVFNTTYAP